MTVGLDMASSDHGTLGYVESRVYAREGRCGRSVP